MKDPVEAQRHGRFIVLEGVDGTGKSTQAELLARYYEARRRPLECVRDPGSTAVGEAVREVLLDPASAGMSLPTEVLLYMAARAQLVRERIRPALERGTDVLCDRFVLSTLIYQGLGAGEPLDTIRRIGHYACGGIEPDLLLLLELPASRADERIGASRDRIEARPPDFQRRVREGFARAEEIVPWRIRRIAADGSPEEVFEAVKRAVEDVL